MCVHLFATIIHTTNQATHHLYTKASPTLSLPTNVLLSPCEQHYHVSHTITTPIKVYHHHLYHNHHHDTIKNFCHVCIKLNLLQHYTAATTTAVITKIIIFITLITIMITSTCTLSSISTTIKSLLPPPLSSLLYSS